MDDYTDERKELSIVKEIKRWKKARKAWHEAARKAERRYSYEPSPDANDVGIARLNLFWAIVGIIKPAVYVQAPKVEVSRRWPNRNPTAFIASQMLDRATQFQVDISDYDVALSAAIDDALISGQGTIWVRYEPVIENKPTRIAVIVQQGIAIDPVTQQQYDPQQVQQDDQGSFIPGPPAEQLVDEKVIVEYVHWKDFLFEPAKTWAEVKRVARQSHLSKREFIEKFGEESYQELCGKRDLSELSEAEKEAEKNKICVYEVWDKEEKKVSWVSEYLPDPIKESDPPLKFDGFFPCPPPLVFTLSPGTQNPRPDVAFYQDQLDTIDVLTEKAQDIARYLKIVNIYSEAEPELARIFTAQNGSALAIKQFDRLAQSGGIKSAYEILSMADHVSVLTALNDAIEKQKNEIYEITGISDIIRGVSKANETLGAQQLKSQNFSARLGEKQRKVAVFCRDVVRLIAQIIKNHFDPQTIIRMTGAAGDQETEAYLQSAIALLREDHYSDYLIEIETDSTKFRDTEAAKQSAVELTNSLAGLLNSLMPFTESIPQLVPVISELLLFTAKQFEAGKIIEGRLEQALQQMEKTIEENKQRADAQAQQEAQIQQQQAQQQAQPEPQQPQPDNSQELALKAQEMAARVGVEREKIASAERIASAQMNEKRDLETMKITADMKKHQVSELNKLTTSQLKTEADTRRKMML
jgi:hypothetical protein